MNKRTRTGLGRVLLGIAAIIIGLLFGGDIAAVLGLIGIAVVLVGLVGAAWGLTSD